MKGCGAVSFQRETSGFLTHSRATVRELVTQVMKKLGSQTGEGETTQMSPSSTSPFPPWSWADRGRAASFEASSLSGFGKENCGGGTQCVARAGGTEPQPQLEVLFGTEPERNALAVSSPPSTRAAPCPNSPGNLGPLCVLCNGEGCQGRENEKGKSQSKPLKEEQMRTERSQANKPETLCRLESLHLTRNILKF